MTQRGKRHRFLLVDAEIKIDQLEDEIAQLRQDADRMYNMLMKLYDLFLISSKSKSHQEYAKVEKPKRIGSSS